MSALPLPAATSATEVLFASERFVLGSFRCVISDPRWARENRIEDGFNIVFPAAPVQIIPTGMHRLLGDRNHVLLYNQGQTFRREPASPDGDVCTFLVAEEDYLRRVAYDAGLGVARGRFSFAANSAPLPAGLYLASRVVIARMASGRLSTGESDRCLDEITRRVMAEVARGAPQGEPPVRLSPEHVAMVEGIKLVLADFPASTKLPELAQRASVSPFHLARVFRKCTGFTLHAYRDQLRLRFCLDRLIAGEASVSELAYVAGYSSPSHLSDNFRRAFGFPPSRTKDVVEAP